MRLWFGWLTPARKFPVILPHELLPWLKRHHAFPDISAATLAEYWQHFQDIGIDWAKLSQNLEDRLHPLFLWGDDVQYNQHFEKLETICLGHVLDSRKFSMETSFPLFCIREDPWFWIYFAWFLWSLKRCCSQTCVCKSLFTSNNPDKKTYCARNLPRYWAQVSLPFMPCLNQRLGFSSQASTHHLLAWLSFQLASNEVVASMDHLLRGVRINGEEMHLHAAITQVRGDWKWQRDTWVPIGVWVLRGSGYLLIITGYM